MPFITTKTNVTLSREQQAKIASGLGKAIELVPGKTEDSLLLVFEDNARLFLRGDDTQPTVYLTVTVFGNPFHCGYEQLSASIADIFQEIVGIERTRTFIKYEDIPSWSVGGWTFGRAEAK